MQKRQLLLYFTLVFFAYGCAPSADSTSQISTYILPQRPTHSEAILNRDLPYQHDPRISYCEMTENNNSTYSGFRDLQLEPLASLSKIITSAWAVEQLGLDHRFTTNIYLNPIDYELGVFDVYLSTNADPIVNIEKLLFYLSEMNQSGVRRIRNLVVDESTHIYLSVLANPHIELNQVPVATEESQKGLNLIFNSKNWGERTKAAREHLTTWAAKNNKVLQIPNQFSVDNISVKTAAKIDLQKYAVKKTLTSAPLFKYLKNMNVYSNNYLADALFAKLGGVAGFKKFQKNTLKLSDKEMQIYTGSGLEDSTSGSRLDNSGSCFAMLKVLSYFKNKMIEANLNLGFVLLNPTQDTDGTIDQDQKYANSVVLKTGRLFEVAAMNLAGYVSTAKGVVTFVYLAHDFKASESAEMEASRSEMLMSIYSNYPTRSDFVSTEYSDLFL